MEDTVSLFSLIYFHELSPIGFYQWRPMKPSTPFILIAITKHSLIVVNILKRLNNNQGYIGTISYRHKQFYKL